MFSVVIKLSIILLVCLVLKSVFKGREKGDKRNLVFWKSSSDYSISVLYPGQNERHSNLRPKVSKKLGKQVLFKAWKK